MGRKKHELSSEYAVGSGTEQMELGGGGGSPCQGRSMLKVLSFSQAEVWWGAWAGPGLSHPHVSNQHWSVDRDQASVRDGGQSCHGTVFLLRSQREPLAPGLFPVTRGAFVATRGTPSGLRANTFRH